MKSFQTPISAEDKALLDKAAESKAKQFFAHLGILADIAGSFTLIASGKVLRVGGILLGLGMIANGEPTGLAVSAGSAMVGPLLKKAGQALLEDAYERSDKMAALLPRNGQGTSGRVLELA